VPGRPLSQHSNRDVAWQRLRSRLYDHEMRKRMEEQQKLEDTKTDVGWGHQIRSYVLDNSRIKDLRTNVEVSNTQKVLDGDLDAFIAASSSKASEPPPAIQGHPCVKAPPPGAPGRLPRPGLLDPHADLTFDLDPAKTIVLSKIAIERNGAPAVQPLRLHGES
jgi:hypothetical protein